jgi:nicotinamidase/pyrazinamidase
MKTAFFDIDTQIDFLFPAGSLYVPGAERLIPALKRLNHYAGTHGIPLTSSMCAHTEDDPEFRHWPAHCVIGTIGQLKPAELLLEKRVCLSVSAAGCAIEGAQQILFEKNQLDITTSPNFQPLLGQLAADTYVVYGVVTEYCVRCAALALLETGKPVRLVTDAIRTLDGAASAKILREFTQAGGQLATVADICG